MSTEMILFDPMNDPTHSGIETFYETYPKAGSVADVDNYRKNGKFNEYFVKPKIENSYTKGEHIAPILLQEFVDVPQEALIVPHPKVVLLEYMEFPKGYINVPKQQIASIINSGLPRPIEVNGKWRDVVTSEVSDEEWNKDIYALPEATEIEEIGVEITDKEWNKISNIFYIAEPRRVYDKEWKQISNIFALPDEEEEIGVEVFDKDIPNIFASPVNESSEETLADIMEAFAESEFNTPVVIQSPPTLPKVIILPETFDIIGEEVSEEEYDEDIFALPEPEPTKVKTLIDQLKDERIMNEIEERMKEIERNIDELEKDTLILDQKLENPQEYERVVSQTDESYFIYRPIISKEIDFFSRKLEDFNYYKPTYEDPINNIPEFFRKKMQFVGRLWEGDLDKHDLYTFKEHNWQKGSKLEQCLIMASEEQLYHTIRHGKGVWTNRGIDVNKKRDWIQVGSHEYPRKYIYPFVKGSSVICKQVDGLKGKPLLIPYRDVTLSISGRPIQVGE